MKAPVSRRRGRSPMPAPITMDLMGVGEDGNLYVWSEAKQVQPLNRFPVHEDGCIKSGHYVIERNGKAVTAHIGQGIPLNLVVVQIMCNGIRSVALPRKEVESQLLGKHIPDPRKEAEILGMLQRLMADVVARQTAPHRKRGPA